jgi:hypothetical protein
MDLRVIPGIATRAGMAPLRSYRRSEVVMVKILSLDELLEREYEREHFGDDSMTVGICDQQYIAAVLEEPPHEDVRGGYYNGTPSDVVTLMRNDRPLRTRWND